MNYPLISEYIESIKYAEDNFATLTNLRPILDEDGNPIMSSGNFAVVFKMQDEQTEKIYAVKCFTREQRGRASAYRMISDELDSVSSPFIVPFKWLDKELFVNTQQGKTTEFPILLMDWVEGMSFEKYIEDNKDNTNKLMNLSNQFSMLSLWILSQPFAHGDIKPDNIIINTVNDNPILVDYDGMFVPAMKGQKAQELGSPDFRHPLRTLDNFNEHIDDFALALIQLYIDSIRCNSKEKLFNVSELKLHQNDFVNWGKSPQKKLLQSFMGDIRFLLSYHRLLDLLQPSKRKRADMIVKENKRTEIVDIPYLTKQQLFLWKDSIPEENKVWFDSYNVKYSEGWEVLLNFPWDSKLKEYQIRQGCKLINDWAFGYYVWVFEHGGCDQGNCLTKLVLPDTVVKIGKEAFIGCEYLESIELSKNIRLIDDKAFKFCHNLKNINLPEYVYYIGKDVFPESLEFISNNSDYFVLDNTCFYSKDGNLLWVKHDLIKFIIPEGIIRICSGAFNGCNSLKEILLPQGLKIVDQDCLPVSLEFFKSKSDDVLSDSDCLYSSDGTLLWVKKNVKHFSFPKNIKRISENAFNNCHKLRNLSLPFSLETITDFIGDCDNLNWINIPKKIYIEKNSLKTEHGHTPTLYIPLWTTEYFKKLDNNFYKSNLIETKIILTQTSVLPEDVDIPVDLSDWRYGVRYSDEKHWLPGKRIISFGDPLSSSYSIKEGTEIICDNCFYDIKRGEQILITLQQLYIPKSVQYIGQNPFCRSLHDIVCDSPYFLVENNFLLSADKKRLIYYFGDGENAVIPNGVTYIGGGSFSFLELYKLSIPESVQVIGDNPFVHSRFCEIVSESPCISINNGVLFNDDEQKLIACWSNETLFEVPEGTMIIGANVFIDSNVEQVILPSSIEQINQDAFAGSKINKILVPREQQFKFHQIIPEDKRELIETLTDTNLLFEEELPF